MKKIIILGMLAGALLATSCQKDDNFSAGKESTVTFVLESPAMATRAYSDGKTVDRLTYAVYEKGEEEAFREGTIENAFDDNLSATVNLTLVSGKSYDVVFWADKTGSPYTFDEATKSISIDYDGTDAGAATDDVKCNDETLDAFFGSAEITHLTGETNTEEVTLTRPFAQLNIGATDYTTAAFNATNLSVTVPVYTTLNLLTGKVNETSSNVTFTATNLAGTTENQLTFPVENVADYLTMSYLLVPADRELVQVEFSATNADNTTRAHTFANIPVQRNYRTNIYGKLFESEMTYTVKLDPEYGENNENVNNMPIYDGSVTEYTKEQIENAANGTIEISSAADLAGISALSRSSDASALNGKTISIQSDLSFAGGDWTTIKNPGKLTINGNGHTIVGLGASLVIGSGDLTVSNLTIKNANIVGDSGWPSNACVFTSGESGSCVLTNCHVKDCSITGVGNCGLVAYGNKTEFRGCSVEGCYFKGSPIGALTSISQSGSTIENCNIKNCTFDAIYDTSLSSYTAGYIIGIVNGSQPHTYTNISGSGNTFIPDGDKTKVMEMNWPIAHGIYSATLSVDGVAYQKPEDAQQPSIYISQDLQTLPPTLEELTKE